MESILQDPLVVKVVIGIVTGTITVLLGVVGYFLKKNFDSIDKLSDIMHSLKEEFIVNREDSKAIKEDVSDLKQLVKDIEDEVIDVKLKVKEHDVKLNMISNAG